MFGRAAVSWWECVQLVLAAVMAATGLTVLIAGAYFVGGVLFFLGAAVVGFRLRHAR